VATVNDLKINHLCFAKKKHYKKVKKVSFLVTFFGYI